MRVILTQADLLSLASEQVFPKPFLDYVEREWIGLYEAYSDGEEMSEFNLEGHDRQVCFEQDDCLPSDLGWPEYVERVQLGDFEIFRMYVMEAEDIGVLYYSIVDTLDEESEQFLKERAEWNES